MIQKLKAWVGKDDSIKALILTGSRAVEGKYDKLSDYDTAVFSINSSLYTKSDKHTNSSSQLGGEIE